MAKRSQIKELQVAVPRGTPLDSKRLGNLGISRALAHEYVKTGWLEKLGRGVFMFAGDQLARDACLKFLETRIQGLHVAARSALAFHGFRQNIAFQDTLILWGEHRAILPQWFTDLYPARYSCPPLFDEDLSSGYGLASLPEAPGGPMVSVPERALLEMLSEVGVHQELDEARAIMESVRQIRVRQLKVLLTHCRMVKAVRLCVGLATELELPWAAQAREAAAGKTGTGRWVARFKSGRTLILKQS